MHLSRKAEYALRAIAILGAQGTDKSMQAQELSQVGDIPQKFLEQILVILRRGGLVVSKRGVGGGYRIAKAARLISVAEVVTAINGEGEGLAASADATFAGASGIEHCFETATTAYQKVLEETTIEDLIDHDSGDSMVGFGI